MAARRRAVARASSSKAGKASKARAKATKSRARPTATVNPTLKSMDDGQVRWIYQTMRRIRRFEETAEEAFKAAKMRGALHFYIGEEATATGACAALEDGDFITSTHRGHGHCIAKGARMDKMMAELFGRTTGYSGGKGGSLHIADLELGKLGANGIVGAGIPIATGAALGSKLRQDGQVTISFFGDGAGPTGAFHEGVNVAATMKLPVIFLCENNQYGMATHNEFANAAPISARGPAYSIPSPKIDGNDVFEVYETVKEAADRARNGEGPTLIESLTYRHKGHTVLDQKNYRTKEEIAEWVARDPIERFRTAVSSAKRMTAKEFDAIDADIEREIENAVSFAEASPWPTLDAIERDVYAE